MVNSKLNEDIICAQSIISNHYTDNFNCAFNDKSKIYRGTNEYVTFPSYYEALKDKKRILSVIGSGDQIINSILLGSEDINGFDISRFPKYYLMLKLAAIETLSRDDYLSFFIGDLDKEMYSSSHYDKIRCELNGDYLTFWDSIFDFFDQYEISESRLFSSDFMTSKIMINNNPYLQDENYKILKLKIKDLNISFYDGNITKILEETNFKKGFNLINLSNIVQYPDSNFNINWEKVYRKYKEFVERLPLEEKGIALTYFFGFNKRFLESIFSSENYNLEQIERDKSEGLLIYQKR